MASNKFLELQELSDENLAAELEASRQQYSRLKFDHTITGLENPLDIRVLRRDIARINTELRRRELANNTDLAASRSKIRARRRRK
ncbi:MAG: 50S ribosomal protein L29 [Saprospiraceae bacterium]